MKKIIFSLIVFSLVAFTFHQAYGQEPKLATFQESAQVIIDQSLSNNVTASVTLQSTSNQEIKIPSGLEEKILGTERLLAIVITNEEQCVLGVFEQSCIMINIEREGLKGIIAIQDKAKEMGNSLIGDLNDFFGTGAKFHSVFVHVDDDPNRVLDTSGVISGHGTVSAVYVMPKESTDSMYEKITGLLLTKEIRDSGGFYDIAKNLSMDDKSQMTFSIIPTQNTSLFQIKLSLDYPEQASEISEVKPLDFLKTSELKRSEYFSDDFYPLNSLLQIVVLSDEPMRIKKINGNVLPTQDIQGEKFPTDITKAGWVFDPDAGKKIQGKYLFGKQTSVKKDVLQFTIIPASQENAIEVEESDGSLIIVGVIVAFAAGAAIYYLKGFRKSA